MITRNSITKGYTDNDGYFVTEYDKNWKVTSITLDKDNSDQKTPDKTGNTYTYTDTNKGAYYTYNTNSAGVVLNYSVKYNEPLGNTITFRYNDKGILQNSVYKDGVKTTTTTYDSNSEVTDTITKFDFTGVTGLTKTGNIITLGDAATSGLEKYTVNTVNGIDEVLTYSITYSDTNTAADGIKNDFTSSTTYDAQGKVISRQDTNASTDTNPLSSQTDIDATTPGIQIESSSNTKVTNSNGSQTESSTIRNQFGEQKSEFFYDSNSNLTKIISRGQSDFTDTANNNRVITNIFSNTIEYNAGDIVSNVNESTSKVGSTIVYKSSSRTADNVNVNGNIIPHVQSSSWEDERGMSGGSESQFDTKWQLLSESGTSTYIETWNNNTKVTSKYTNTPIWNTTQTKIIGNTGTNKTYVFGETAIRDSVQYRSVDTFDAKGLLTGHKNTSEDLISGDKSTTVYDANWKTISSSSSSSSSFSDATGLHTTTSSYEKVSNFDTAGVLTGYTTTSTWDNFDGVLTASTIHNKGSSVTESNTLDVVKTVTVTENGKITVYNDSGAIISTKIDLSGLGNGTKDSNGFMVYSVTDVNDNVTKYYLKGDKLDRFSTTTSETSTDASGIIHDFSNTTNYDSNGRIVDNILTNEYSYMVGTVKTLRDSSIIKSVDNFDKTGNVIGHTVNSSSKNILENSESTSVTEYNADWTKVISNTDTSISSYTENGVTHTSKTINSTVTNPDGTVTTKSSWEDNDGNKNQSESKYNASGNLLTNTLINGIKSTVYAPDGKIISSSIDVTGLKGIADGVSGLTTYSVIDGNSTTKYYLNAAKNNDLVKYTVSSSDTKVDSGITSRSTNMTTYDDMGNVIAEEGSNSSTYANGVIRESLSYKNINNYNKNGQLLGHTQTSTWSNENGDGNTTKAEFDAGWTLLTNTVTDKQGTTVYDATGTVLSSTSDVASLGVKTSDENLDIYTKTDVNTGFVTITYLTKDTTTIIKSSTTQSGTDAGGPWSNTTTVDATGKVIESSDSYTSNGVIWTNTSTTVYNLDGTHTVINISKKGVNTVANSTIEYSADWEIITNSITANGKTTVYDKDGVITETTIDIVSLGVGVVDGSNTVYTLPGTDGGLTTKYYFTTASLTTVPLLVKYSTSFSGSNVWNDGDTDITTTFSGTTTFDKDGNIISSTSENRNYVGTDTTIPHRDISSTTTTKLADGKVKNEYTWEDNHDNSETSFNTSDATGRSLESESYKVNTHSYTTASGVSHTDVSTSKSVSHYDSLGVLSGYTNTDSSTQDDVVKQSSISKYNAKGRLISEVVTQNGKTTTTNYDADGNVTNTVTVINVAGFPPNLINGVGLESAFKIHTVTDDSSGEVTKYYLSGTPLTLHHYSTTTVNIDTWTDENDHEITATYTNTTTFDSTGKSIGNSGKSESTYVINEETKVIESSTYNNVENPDGTHTNTNEWLSELGSGKSETIFDVNWKKTSEKVTQNGKITTTTYNPNNGSLLTSTTIIDTASLDSPTSQTINDNTYSVYSVTDLKNGNVTKYYMNGSSLHHYSITNDGESSYTYQDEESGEDVTVTNKYSNITNFDANDKVIDTISSNEYSDSKGVIRHSSTQSTKVEQFSGITLTGYTVTNIIDNDGYKSKSIIKFNASDEIESTTITENGKTTQYDANWQVIGTPTFDVTGLIETTSSDGLFTVYTSDSNPNGSITKYYYDNNSATKVLQYYTETNTSSTTWNDGENDITSTQNNTTKFNATGIVIGRSGDNKSTYFVDGVLKERDFSEFTMVESGEGAALIHTQTFASRDESGSTYSSTNISNATWQNISSESSTTYLDSNGIPQTKISIVLTDYDGAARTVTKTEKYNDVTTSISEEHYGTDGNLISRTVNEGIKLTAYNGNGEVTSVSYDFGANQGNYDAVTHLTYYTMPKDANGNVITYYFNKSNPASSILVKFSISTSNQNHYIDDLSQRDITSLITNTTTFDAEGKTLSTSNENRSTYDDILDPTANEKSYSKYTVEDGKQESIFRDEFGNNVSTIISNANGQVISNKNVYTDNVTDHIYESSSTTVYRADGSYTVTTVKKIGTVVLTPSIDEYDVNGVLIEPDNDLASAPTLLGFTPSDDATGVAIDASITLTFNEPIKAGKGNIVISNDTETDLRYISVDDLSQVTLNETTLSINLTKNLLAGSNYSVTIESDAIKDLAGNKFAGILNLNDFNFTTLVGGSYLISGAGSTNTLTGIDTFNISSGEYTHTISGGFTTGDRLNFFPDAILNVVPDDDDADNSQSITATDPATGSVATITFTNLIVGQDEGIYNLQSLKNFVSVGNFAGIISGTTGQDTFTIAVGQNVSINNFSSGDTLKLFPNAILNIVPDANLTDGIKLANVSDPLTGATSVITLTGLTDEQDAGVFNMPSFETQFGATSLVYV